MKRRSKVSLSAVAKTGGKGVELQLGDTRGIVGSAPNKTTSVTLRLSGPWHVLWQRLRASVPGVSDAELLRQGVALRMALAARDAKGEKPHAYIEFTDETGTRVTRDLEAHVGLTGEQEP